MSCINLYCVFCIGIIENGKVNLKFCFCFMDYVELCFGIWYLVLCEYVFCVVECVVCDFEVVFCGKCVFCCMDYFCEWVNCCLFELKYYCESCFCIFMYDDEYVLFLYIGDENGEVVFVMMLCKCDFQFFMKCL